VICHNCEVAGYINAEANRQVFWNFKLSEKVRELARSWHRTCKGRSYCTCQHRVGDYTDRTKVEDTTTTNQRVKDDATAELAKIDVSLV
jgi:hypothetical protein